MADKDLHIVTITVADKSDNNPLAPWEFRRAAHGLRAHRASD
jgi:hypothetical protein